MATGSRGALRSAGGASENVSSDITSPAKAMPATIQNSGRQAWNEAWVSPMQRARRDRAEDAQVEDHRRRAELAHRVAQDQRRRRGDEQQARAQPLQHVPDDEHRRRRRAAAASTEPITSKAA